MGAVTFCVPPHLVKERKVIEAVVATVHLPPVMARRNGLAYFVGGRGGDIGVKVVLDAEMVSFARSRVESVDVNIGFGFEFASDSRAQCDLFCGCDAVSGLDVRGDGFVGGFVGSA